MSDSIILAITNFTIWYEPIHHKALTIRDMFINAISSPWDFFSPARDKLVIFENLSMNVNKGDVIGLLGINGVGKTTLCRYLSGIIPSDRIKINGNVKAIFDTNLSFYQNLTGRENATILAEIMYTNLSNIKKKAIIEEALAFSELGDFLDVPLNNYSRGMKAKLYLSIVTAQEADLLVLDEIWGGTDIFFSEKLEVRIKDLITKSGAVVMVSHNIDDIKNYCNRIIILSNKKIVFDGDPEIGIKKYTSALL